MDQVKEIDEQKLKTAFGDAFTSEVVAKCETDFESLDNCLELEYISPTTAVFNGADSPSSIERSIISFFFLLLCARICCVNHANFAGLNIKTFRIRKLFKRVRWDSEPWNKRVRPTMNDAKTNIFCKIYGQCGYY